MAGTDRQVDGERQPAEETPAVASPSEPFGAGERPSATDPEVAGVAGHESEPVGAADPEAEAAELIAQIRQLAGPDPVAVRTVVADVLAALDRVSGGTLREQLPYEHERAPEPGARMPGDAPADGYPVEPHPVEPTPPSPHPVEPQPGQPQPGRPGPADPHPAAPRPGPPHPTQPRPTDPHPVKPRPSDPHPAEPGPETPGPIERRPVQRDGEDRT